MGPTDVKFGLFWAQKAVRNSQQENSTGSNLICLGSNRLRSSKMLDQVIQIASRFGPRFRGSKNIGPNKVKFGPFWGKSDAPIGSKFIPLFSRKSDQISESAQR
jgi:hypothetical protein